MLNFSQRNFNAKPFFAFPSDISYCITYSNTFKTTYHFSTTDLINYAWKNIIIIFSLWLDFSNKLFLEKRKISSELTWLCLHICRGFVGRLPLFFPKLVSIQKNTKYCSRFLHFTYRISLYGFFLHATLNPFGFFHSFFYLWHPVLYTYPFLWMFTLLGNSNKIHLLSDF